MVKAFVEILGVAESDGLLLCRVAIAGRPEFVGVRPWINKHRLAIKLLLRTTSQLNLQLSKTRPLEQDSSPRVVSCSLNVSCWMVKSNGRRMIFSKLSYILLMAGGKEKGAGESKVKDPVSQMRIQRQGLHKEAINERINDNFQINRPSNINFYSEKPNNNPYLLMKMKEEGKVINGVDYEEKLRDGHYKTELTSEINDKLKTVTHTPKDKWSTPQTSNQEIGWLANQRFEQHSKFVHKREGCPETHYLDSYITMRHVSLFSNKSKKG